MINVCECLEKIGNLDRWEIENLDEVIRKIEAKYEWKKCPISYISKIDSALTIDFGIP